MEIEFFFHIQRVETALPAPLTESLKCPPEGLIQNAAGILCRLIRGKGIRLDARCDFFRDVFGNLFNFFIRRLPPLAVLRFQDFAELVEPRVEIIAVIQIIRFACIPLFYADSVAEEVLVGTASVILQFCDGTVKTSSFHEKFARKHFWQTGGGILIPEPCQFAFHELSVFISFCPVFKRCPVACW